MVVVGVYSTVTFWGQFVNLVKAAIGPLLILVGAFIVWLETDEWKLQREEKQNGTDQGLQREFQPQQTNTASNQQATSQTTRDYDELLSGTVEEVKDTVREMDNPDYRAILEAEKQSKDRKTVKEFLKRRI